LKKRFLSKTDGVSDDLISIIDNKEIFFGAGKSPIHVGVKAKRIVRHSIGEDGWKVKQKS